MNFGIIGTNWITDQFIKAAKKHPEFSIGAVFSRSEERAREFATKYSVNNVYTDIETMFKSGNIEAVYIATPNFLHIKQSVLAMKNGIHVLCEKPAVIAVDEMKQVMNTAEKFCVTYMEAMKSTVTPTFLNLKRNIDKVGKLRRLVFHYNQYSSRYDKYKQGIIENAFKPELGNGAHMDLGVYCLAPVVHLVGVPISVLKNKFLLSTNAQGQGSMILCFEDYEAIIMYSKVTNSYLPSEIQGEEGVIEIDQISEPRKVVITYRDGQIEDLSISHEYDIMYYEIEEFIRSVKNKQIESKINTHHISLEVTKLLTE